MKSLIRYGLNNLRKQKTLKDWLEPKRGERKVKFKQHILEEKLIDYLLNNVIGKEYESIQKHIHHCDKCRERLYYWQNLLLHNIDELKNPSYTLSSRIWHSWEKCRKKIVKINV